MVTHEPVYGSETASPLEENPKPGPAVIRCARWRNKVAVLDRIGDYLRFVGDARRFLLEPYKTRTAKVLPLHIRRERSSETLR